MTYQVKSIHFGKCKSFCQTLKDTILKVKWNLLLSSVMHRDDQDFGEQIKELNKNLRRVKACGLKTTILLVAPTIIEVSYSSKLPVQSQ